jgi:hypothetical protein
MANEVMVPLLPCRDIEEIEAFYGMLGFERTYHQVKPNPYVALRREDINIHFFGMPGFEPRDSYGTCLVVVEDTDALYRSFAAAMRETHGKVLVSGIPRMTRPRKRKNADGHSGFAIVDPGGNWIRITAAKPDPSEDSPPPSRLRAMLDNAVVMGDSHGLDERAVQILDDALARYADPAPATDLLEALAYRPELAVRLKDRPGAVDALTRARSIELTEIERAALPDTIASLDDLEASLRSA